MDVYVCFHPYYIILRMESAYHAKIGSSLVHFENKTLTAPSLIDKTNVE
jgi:hypothetical protein